MRLLLDTNILIWAAGDIDLLPKNIRSLIEETNNELLFSPASIWETAITHGLGRDGFQADPFVLRYRPIHKDPFDRILIAQAIIEGVSLITVEQAVLQYPGLSTYPWDSNQFPRMPGRRRPFSLAQSSAIS